MYLISKNVHLEEDSRIICFSLFIIVLLKIIPIFSSNFMLKNIFNIPISPIDQQKKYFHFNSFRFIIFCNYTLKLFNYQ